MKAKSEGSGEALRTAGPCSRTRGQARQGSSVDFPPAVETGCGRGGWAGCARGATGRFGLGPPEPGGTEGHLTPGDGPRS